MGIQLAPQRAQLATRAAVQDGVHYPQGATESSNNTTYRGNLHMAGGVSHQIHIATGQLAAHRNPAGIDGDSRPLVAHGRQAMFVEEAFQNGLRRSPVFTDETDNSLSGRMWNEPVEIGGVLRNK